MQIFMHLYFGIFVQIFMKFSPKCITKKFLGMMYTILGSFWPFLIGKGGDIPLQIRPRKIPETYDPYVNVTSDKSMPDIFHYK